MNSLFLSIYYITMKKFLLFLKKYLIVFLLLIYIILAYIFDFVSCPITLITGFPCSGCGITRATISLFKFRFYEAFYYQPCIFILPFILVIILFKNKTFFRSLYNSKILWIILIIIVISIYIIRMIFIFPNEPISYNDNNLILIIYNWLIEI